MAKVNKEEIREQRKQEWEEKLQKEQRKSMLQKIAIWGGIGLATVLAVVGLVKLSETPAPTATEVENFPKVTTEDIIMGNKNGSVTLVEYADFQCPACKAYHPVVKQLMSEFKDLKFVFRNFPLRQPHKNAGIAAQAGYAAHNQGKFQEMYDTLYDNQDAWATSGKAQEVFADYANQLGLDIDKFKRDLESDETKKFVAGHEQQAASLRLDSTPTFFINGKQLIPTPRGYDEFKAVIERELNK